MSTKNQTEHDYLSTVTTRLGEKGYRIQRDVKYSDQVFQYVARRTKHELAWGGRYTTFFLFAHLASADIHSLRDFSTKAFKCASKISGFHAPRGLGYTMVCFPVAITDSVSPDVAEGLRRSEPPKHWAASEMLVVYSLDNSRLYYCEVTPAWGRIYYDDMRRTIEETISP